MSRLDATAGAFVTNNQVIRPVHFLYMDFVGDPVRANDAGWDITLSGNANANFNGLFKGLTGKVAELSPIRMGDGGSQTVTARLFGLPGLDDDTIALVNNEANWKGRLCQVQRIVWDQNNTAQGTFQHLYTGYMVDLMHSGEPPTEEGPGSQSIEVTIEGYLAAFSQASNRTYLNSKDFDPGDLSGDLSVTASTGAGSTPGGSGTVGNTQGWTGVFNQWFQRGQQDNFQG